jgi:uncharacterized protein YjiS (DUF1127 family)
MVGNGKEAGNASAPRDLGHRFSELARRVARDAIAYIAVWRERHAIERELAAMDDAALADMGILRSQIHSLARAYPAADNLLGRMLQRLGLEGDTARMPARQRDDLYRTCVLCTERGECRHWLAKKDANPEGYKAFCPNAWVLERLRNAALGRKAPAPTIH